MSGRRIDGAKTDKMEVRQVLQEEHALDESKMLRSHEHVEARHVANRDVTAPQASATKQTAPNKGEQFLRESIKVL